MLNVSSARVARELVYTTHFVNDTVTVRELRTWFQVQSGARSLGVRLQDGSFGLITRRSLNQHLLEGCSADFTVRQQPDLVVTPFSVDTETPIQEMMEQFLSAHGGDDAFFDDIVLHSNKEFAGLVRVRDAVVNQLDNLRHKLSAMEAQQAALSKQNKELFENSFRQGQRETQYRSFFDQVPVPTVVFDQDGKFLGASQRFYRLSGYTRKDIDAHFYFSRLFAEDWIETRQKGQDETSGNPMQTLTLVPAEGSTFRVSAVVEISPDWGHLMVSVMGLTGHGMLAAPELLDVTAEKPESRITQAIRVKLEEQKAEGLARSVASNLIDREDEVDRLMKKLEKIFEVSEKVEKIQAQLPSAGGEESKEPRLQGNLAEFSVVDLCQILIQGTKTGQLLLLKPGDGVAATIYFYCGGMVHAECGEVRGTGALVPILKIKEGNFDFIFNQSSPETTISGDSMGLLMDACRKVDEEAR